MAVTRHGGFGVSRLARPPVQPGQAPRGGAGLGGQAGWASVAPASFTLPGRVTCKSPIDKAAYERIHALRASEIAPRMLYAWGGEANHVVTQPRNAPQMDRPVLNVISTTDPFV